MTVSSFLHLHHATFEYEMYTQMCNTVEENPHDIEAHINFDYIAYALLPSLKIQPSQLYFIMGLNFNIFTNESSNIDELFLFGLLERHLPRNKTEKEFLFMVDLLYKFHYINSKVICLLEYYLHTAIKVPVCFWYIGLQ